MFLTETERAVAFHGHHCPGLSIGIRIGAWAIDEFGHATDEEVVCVTECDSCPVDAVQVLLGCTFGKGNLIFLDYGKTAFTFFRRHDEKGLRVVWKNEFLADLNEEKNKLDKDDMVQQDRVCRKMIERIMQGDFETMFSVGKPNVSLPERARIYKNICCDDCGERVMSSRIVEVCQGGSVRRFCIPCHQKGGC